MKKKTIGLLDKEQGYVERLSHYLTDSSRFPYFVSVFTDLSSFNAYQRKNEIDALLTSEKDISDEYTGTVINLCVNPGEDGIYKYSSADLIASEILKRMGDDDSTLKMDVMKSKTKFIGVFSPVARSLKTSFCMVLGQSLAKKNRVLYLNFESFSGMSFETSANDKANLSDLMYCFNNLKKDFRTKFRESLVEINGLEYISPAFCYLDLSYVSAEDWFLFLNEIKAMDEFDYVIFDLSDYISGVFDVFLRQSDIIYTMSAGDVRARNKIFQYEEMLRHYDYSDILEKTHKLNIPIIRNLPDTWDRVMYSEFSDYVKKELKGDFIF